MLIQFNLTARHAVAVLGALVLSVSVTVVVIEKDSIKQLTNIGNLRKLSEAATKEPKKHPAFQFDRDLPTFAKDPALSTLLTDQHVPHKGEFMPFKLTQQAADWCMPPSFPEMDYYHCDPNKTVNRVPLFGGLTNSLKMLLLAVIDSYEQGRCFYIDESDTELKLVSGGVTHSLIKRYFEPIGLDPDNIVIQKAILDGRVETKTWGDVWNTEVKRRVLSQKYKIPYLTGDDEIDGHRLKFLALIRMWRPLELVRNSACLALENHGLVDEYLAFSVRRGDKHTVEKFDYPTASEYIKAAETSINIHFGGFQPKIFVATDDCTVMSELRGLKPDWTFVSQCDLEAHVADKGFALTDMKNWNTEMTDAHYAKFFAELYGLAAAKFVIGVAYTNVSWWVLFMRRARLDAILFLDHPEPSVGLDW